MRNARVRIMRIAVVAVLSLAFSATGWGAKPPALGEFNPAHETVELFAAEKAGQIEVKFILRDEAQGRLFITNKTAKALNVQLPEVFAGVPVLAQFFPPGGPGGQPAGINGNNGQNQTVGGGNNNNNGPNNLQRPCFNVPAEKVGEMKVNTVCLEHGKPKPRSAIPYKLVPLDAVTADQKIGAVLREQATGKYEQKAAQAAAWHVANGMKWDELANIKGELTVIGRYDPYFTRIEIESGKALVAEAEKKLTEAKVQQTRSPGESTATTR